MTERRLLQIVELDVDRCTRVYGTAPCAAVLGTTGVRKCYNTRFTCQDPANFERGTLTLRFAPNQMGLPKGELVFPALRSVSTQAQEINLSGIDPNRGPLGARAEVRVEIDDFTYSDFETDPYQAERVTGAAQTDEAGYNPQDRGTFWAKFRARNPYVVGRFLRVREGYVGQAFADMRTKHYVITEINGPDARRGAMLVARDILDLADNDKALAPAPSLGRLAAPMADDATEFTLSGDPTEYPQNGFVCIGSEVIEYTRTATSAPLFTVVRRGAEGTDASAHGAFDTVQTCIKWDRAFLYEVVRDLLVDFANVPPSFIPYSDWQAEGNRWQVAYRVSRLLTRPTGIVTLLAELAIFGLQLWWDEEAQEIRYLTNRPIDIGETYTEIVDTPAPEFSTAAHIIDDSVSVRYAEDQRLSRVQIWHGMINPTGSTSDISNFRKLSIAGDLSQESPEKYGQQRIREFFTPWLGNEGDFVTADSICRRLRDRYRDTPLHITFEVDAKDAAIVQLGARVQVFSRSVADETGKLIPAPMQIRSVSEVVSGHRIRAEAETFTFTGRYGFVTEDARPVYGSSSAAQKERGTYIVGPSLVFSDGTGPYIMF
jgi:hypothetical protein